MTYQSSLKSFGVKKNTLLKKRTYAFIIDLVLIFIINKIILFSYINFIRTFFADLLFQVPNFAISEVGNLNLLSFAIVFWGYFIISYYMSNGKTLGKFIFNLKVTTQNSKNQKLGFKECFLRTAGYFFCYGLGIILLAIPYIQEDGRGIPDWCSGTEVISSLPKELTKVEKNPQLELFDHKDQAA